MSALAKLSATVLLLLVIVGLGTADAVYHGENLPAFLRSPIRTETVVSQGVAKKRGPDVLATLTQQDFEIRAEPETNIIQQVIGSGVPAQYRVLLKDGERAGYIVWVDTPAAKTYFAAIKEALLVTLSDEGVKDLKDETYHDEGQPVVNVVSFRDPDISDENIVLIRVQERIYEIHQAADKQTETRDLIESLVRR